MAQDDPYRHWDGEKWLHWDGTAWVPEESRADIAPTHSVTTDPTQVSIVESASARVAGGLGHLKAWADDRKEKATEHTAKDLEKTSELTTQVAEATATSAGLDTTGAIFVGVSHDEGRNAAVVLFPDRIERVRAKRVGSFSKARQDTEMTPIRSVTSVKASKDGWHTKVSVYASANVIDFRLGHAEALRFKEEIQKLMLAAPDSQQAESVAPSITDHIGQLKQLGELRDSGVLTTHEFEEKKAELLSRI